jgi:hypothetical protein|nr:MAG TPA: hypothetical protein [Caudoviricetes sp.]DAY21809.1 MAG TPA: hypothetical protein [Caudoviricetes sp.]
MDIKNTTFYKNYIKNREELRDLMKRKKESQIDKDEYIRKHMELDSYDFIFSELKKSIELGEQIDLADFFKEYEKEEIREEISKLRQEIGLLIV